jgi:hypothetical protein
MQEKGLKSRQAKTSAGFSYLCWKIRRRFKNTKGFQKIKDYLLYLSKDSEDRMTIHDKAGGV